MKKPKSHLRAVHQSAGAASPSNGAGHAEPHEDQIPADPVVAVVAETLRTLAAHLTPELAHTIAAQAMAEQTGLAPVLQDLAPGSPNMEAHPILVMRVIDPQGNVGTIQAPKSLSREHTLSEAAMLGHMLAMVTSPIARGLLYAYGYRLEFGQAPLPQPKPTIIL